MMFLSELLLAFIVAVLLTAIFAAGFRRTGPWDSVILFFLVVLLAAWAGGIWIGPVGPALFNLYWIPFVFIGLLIALLLAAAGPTYRPRTPREAQREVRDEARSEAAAAEAAVALGWFFWILLLGLLVAIVIRYIIVLT